MTPVPLTAPDGTVRAWACGVCWNVRLGYSHAWAYDAEDVEEMRRNAERCCTCFDCGAPRPPPAKSCLYCDACAAAKKAANEALNARVRETLASQPPTVECSACSGSGERQTCSGSGEVEVTP